MIILCIILIPLIYTIFKLILHFIVCKFGKFSYDGLSVAGFSYDSSKDIFYSTRGAWQKNFGYGHIYDVTAPIFRMIIDTEPIRFQYNNKNWLITFWKGQYGITTGAEIGIYCTKEKKITKNTIYLPIEDDEMLDMSFILYKKKQKIIEIKAKHWWLAAFRLGMFTRPKDLTMDINITFKDSLMLESFLKAFKKLGYKDKDIKIIDKTFIFTYKKPRSHKVWTRNLISDFVIQALNHRNVKLYNKYLIDSIDNKSSTNDKLIMVKDLIPNILKCDSEENTKEKKVKKIEKMVNKNNVLLLKDDIYSSLRDENE